MDGVLEPAKNATFGDDCAMSANDKQIGGDHYKRLSIQPWDAMQAWMTPEEFAGFLKGNAIKYLARNKNGIEDLEKARHYIDKLIELKKPVHFVTGLSLTKSFSLSCPCCDDDGK